MERDRHRKKLVTGSQVYSLSGTGSGRTMVKAVLYRMNDAVASVTVIESG